MKRTRLISLILRYLVLALILLFLLFPLYWSILTSFKTNMQAYQFPPTLLVQNPTVQAYVKLFTENAEFFVYYRNNFLVSGLTAGFTTAVAILAGYALSRFHFRWNAMVAGVLYASQMFPIVSRMISLYGLLGRVNLLNTLTGLTLALIATMVPFTTMLMSSFFDSVPMDIEEAARIDGASRMQVMTRVVIPLVKPGLVSVLIYSFLMTWDDYLHCATLIQSDQLRTLSTGVALRYLGELSYDWSLVNTISVVAMLPMILIFFFFQKYMVKGLVAGAVKG
ncbi:carbohydrate ABC transporter permease [Shuttleworthella satelles]|uniref:carbohydrate ABC transporter permease n=1 Tax=Shuttleworthella satelles TaxID=177972 RepID=UPI002593C8BE|nr:carbohydrate ABC transporter permease [Shuttleworthia satelles]